MFFTSTVLLCSGLATIVVFVFGMGRIGAPSRKQAEMVDDTADEEVKMKTVDVF
ncbi:hypothetical protein FOXG_21358 [Fusarium oxysporum f. sp. lycopersici 4287]|uniref:Uncharacterized protein n=1 Tax=Fusarium oxysporum f. sp. lycopersici (strain 4287 / CBS 123668 / FGSC 9935 / NRRL 34936) TaxID=426428 RepID=A0A0J9VY98_FUSO4|nr:hypothetical protein FOXG_20949 [Fusarium oxysporum f. sp. lycopersici 4287]XP_018253560.1 hypothetical protein FOXG_21358 [Fusarium oxysporum f. sp. lycopersici 4287]EWZ78187.1 hypothetical protein FOWG_17489 [Fusarium oxysporum f. sp. lycopersici MN25]KNB13845.1 hypothetical protein FOXG_20949 [Fusarium oxysporum f. sp. lycopersici 4287]KNB15515.1 hypothetical protein FOXG_21358 [Fusarium oxysporum f. sp. lycopersici 4287]